MYVRILSLLVPLLLVVSLLLPAYSAERENYVESVKVDLNGDGKVDNISLNVNEDTGDYRLTINGISVKGNLEPFIAGLAVVDIQTRDKYKEVVVHTDGPSDDFGDDIYWYNDKAIISMGHFDGWTTFTGSGFIYVNQWQGFWEMVKKYTLTDKHKLAIVPQPFYYVGVTATVGTSIPIYADKTLKTVVANLQEKSRAIILLNDGEFYLFKSTTGLVGWVKGEQTILKSFTDLPAAD